MLEPLEPLERRRMLSVTLEDGVLTVTGTENADQLGVGRSTTMIVVNDNGTTSEWDPALVTSVVINALGGNDQVAVVRPVAGAAVRVGPRNVPDLHRRSATRWLQGWRSHDGRTRDPRARLPGSRPRLIPAARGVRRP